MYLFFNPLVVPWWKVFAENIAILQYNVKSVIFNDVAASD